MSANPKLVRILKILSSLIALAGIVFVVQQMASYGEQLKSYALPDNIVIFVIAVSCLYGASNLLLAIGWHKILRSLDVTINLQQTVKIYAVSQLGKYVPGNIFQFVGRHTIALSEGISNGKLTKSTLFEFIALILAGIICIPLSMGYLSSEVPPILPLFFLFLFGRLVLLFYWKIFGRELAHSFLFYLCFLLSSGFCFGLVFYTISQQVPSFSSSMLIIGSYIIAWLAGLLSPGAPAGLGVREAVLTLMLSSIAPAPIVLLSVLLSRLSTVIGDVLFFVLGQTLIVRQHSQTVVKRDIS